jgi:hypothetical protein
MNPVSLVALSLAAAIATTAGSSAMAQTPNASARPAPWVQTGDAAYPPPPTPPPPGTHYEWIFSYDHHANYLGHWQIVRDH